MKGALSVREIVWTGIQAGVDIKYLAMRYSVPFEKLEHAKKEWDRRQAKADAQRAAMAGGDASGLRGAEQSDSETTLGVESVAGAGL